MTVHPAEGCARHEPKGLKRLEAGGIHEGGCTLRAPRVTPVAERADLGEQGGLGRRSRVHLGLGGPCPAGADQKHDTAEKGTGAFF